jgi:hypothetical protein
VRLPWSKSESEGLHPSGLPTPAPPDVEHRDPQGAPSAHEGGGHEHFELKQVAYARNSMEGEMIEGLLRAEGIKCMLQSTGTAMSGNRGLMVGPCEVLVRAEDVQRAHEVLAASASS